MGLLRKIIPIGNSQGITIPKQWLNWIERKTGQKIVEVTVEVNGALKIIPIIEKRIQQ